jgi:uncharacterized protein (TIGR03435 family)
MILPYCRGMALERHSGSYTGVLLLAFWQVLATGITLAQPAGPALAFEVVSIKPMATDAQVNFYGCRRGPGSKDPGQINCSHWRPTQAFPTAYGVSFTLISFPKANGDMPEYQIAAKVPAGSTKEDVSLMWQRFLEDQFKVKVHRETREITVYELVVAKGGFKAKGWVNRKPDDPAEVPNEPGTPPKRDKDGFPIIAAGQTMGFFTGGSAHFVAPAGTMKQLAQMLEGRLSIGGGTLRPVVDATGLEGKYDVKLAWSLAADNLQTAKDAPEGESMLEALESQLGLKIRQGKASLEMLVVDPNSRLAPFFPGSKGSSS